MSTIPRTNPRERGLARLALLIGTGVVVAIVGVGAGIYFLAFSDDSPPPLEITKSKSTTQNPGAGSDLAGTWNAATDGVAGYRVREKLGFLPAESDAVGRTSDVTGEFTLTDDGGLEATDISVEVDLTTLKSDDDRRDGRIREQGLESARFPKATFVSTGPIEIPESSRSGTEITVNATGDMTIHGVTKKVTIPIKALLDGDRIQLVGSLTFPLTDFDIDKPSSIVVVSIDDDATLEFQLFFTKG